MPQPSTPAYGLTTKKNFTPWEEIFDWRKFSGALKCPSRPRKNIRNLDYRKKDKQ
jgi:hypothetical protein